jgi:hypothetical protein
MQYNVRFIEVLTYITELQAILNDRILEKTFASLIGGNQFG